MLDGSLGVPYYRPFNIWLFPFLKIEKFRDPSLTIKKLRDSTTWKYIHMEDLPNFYFMFLIDVKFISKLLEMRFMEMYHFSILVSTRLSWKIDAPKLYLKYFPKANILLENIFLEQQMVDMPFKIFGFFGCSDSLIWIFKDDSMICLAFVEACW